MALVVCSRNEKASLSELRVALTPLVSEEVLKRRLSATIDSGKRLVRQGQYEKAATQFSNALKVKPGLSQALVCRGFCYLSLGLDKQAQEDLEMVIERNTGFSRNVYVLLAVCCARQGDYLVAIRALGRCLAHFRNFGLALVARGELFLKVRDFKRARSDFRQVLRENLSHALQARRGLADALRGLGELSDASAHYGRCLHEAQSALQRLRLNSSSTTLSAGLDNPSLVCDHSSPLQLVEEEHDDESLCAGDSNMRPQCPLGQRPATTSETLTSTFADPSFDEGCLQAFTTEVLVRRATLRWRMGDIEGACVDLLEALRVDPQHGLALFWYGRLLVEQCRLKEAPAFLEAAVELHPDTRAASLGMLGAIQLTLSRPDLDGATEMLAEAVRLRPGAQELRATHLIAAAARALCSEAADPTQSALHSLSLLEKATVALSALSSALVQGDPHGDTMLTASVSTSSQSGEITSRRPWRGSMSVQHVEPLSPRASDDVVTASLPTPRRKTPIYVQPRSPSPRPDTPYMLRAIAKYSVPLSREMAAVQSRSPTPMTRATTASPWSRTASPTTAMPPLRQSTTPPVLSRATTPMPHASGSGIGFSIARTSCGGWEYDESNHASNSCCPTSWCAAHVSLRGGGPNCAGEAMKCSSLLQLVASTEVARTSLSPPLLHQLRSVALSRVGRLQESLTECMKALALSPDDKAAHFNVQLIRGVICSHEAELEAAVGHFTKAVRLQPNRAEPRVRRAAALAGLAHRQIRASKSVTSSSVEASAGSVDTADARHLLSMDSSVLEARARGALTEEGARFVADALEELGTLEQPPIRFAEDTDTLTPWARRLRVACLVCQGRQDEAIASLGRSSDDLNEAASEGLLVGGATGTLAAYTLLHAGRIVEAVSMCTGLLQARTHYGEAACDIVATRILRAQCYAALGDMQEAFIDCREALVLAPDQVQVHEVSAELFFSAGHYAETLTAINTASKLRGLVTPRLAYLKSLTYLARQDASTALGELNRMLRHSPCNQAAARARDGAHALTLFLDERDFRQARIKFNVLISEYRTPEPVTLPGSDGLSGGFPLFLRAYELLQFRGLCYLYEGDAGAAALDFEASLKEALTLDSDMPKEEVRAYECDMIYNVLICCLLERDYERAMHVAARLTSKKDAVAMMGSQAQSLVWFLYGMCQMLLGEAYAEGAQSAFMKSYAFDPACVDSFLRRHRPHIGNPTLAATASKSPTSPMEPPPTTGRRGRRPPPALIQLDDETIHCLRCGIGTLVGRLPAVRIETEEALLHVKAAGLWPAVPGPAPTNFCVGALLAHPDVAVPDPRELPSVRLLAPWEAL